MKTFLSSLLVFQILLVSAQEKQNNVNNDASFIGINLHSGMVVNNYIYFDSFPQRAPSALIEFKFGKQTKGSKNWQQFYGFPEVGMSAIAGYLGNTNEFGYMFGVLPNIAFNTNNKKKWSLKIKTGFGFAWFNKPYDSITNPYNILIGSSLTALATIDLYFKRNIIKNLNFEFGLSYIHASNGHTGLPNVGLNIITASAGLKYYINSQTTEFSKKSNLQNDKKLNYIVRLGLGFHKFGNELGPPDSPLYPIYDAAIYAGKSVGTLGSAYIGFGYKYYTSFYDNIINEDLYDEKYHLNSSVITLLLAYEFEMGQISLLAQGGINVYNPFWPEFTRLVNEDMTFYKKIEGLISTRLGLQYYLFEKEKFNKNIFLGLYIKANMGGADFVSLSTGFKF